VEVTVMGSRRQISSAVWALKGQAQSEAIRAKKIAAISLRQLLKEEFFPFRLFNIFMTNSKRKQFIPLPG
jgi:hypothetical protein